MTEHTSAFPFADRTGLDPDFFEPVKMAHFGVEAPVGDVSRCLAEASQFLAVADGSDRRRLEIGVAGNPRGDSWPLIHVFQFRGQNCTQAFSDLRSVKSELQLARHLSTELDTRCLCLGVTDDSYYSHALFASGTIEELVVFAMDIDVVRILRALGLEIPEHLEYVDPDDFMSSEGEEEFAYRRDGGEAHNAESVGDLVSEVGCYLHTTYMSEGSVHGISGVVPDDLVRLDVIW